MSRNKYQFVLVVISLLLMPLISWAGTTGKIAGKVIDADTRQALPGVNVVIEGTTLGAATDLEGLYYIINIPPGKYTLKFLFIGFKTLAVEGVKVQVDFTTRQDARLIPEAIEMGEVTVVADRPLVQVNQTATVRTVTSEEIKALPKMEQFQDIVALQPGVVGRGNEIHLRGGRSGEIMYMVDGMAVKDILFSGTSALMLTSELISEISIISGSYNAEYGNAQSGVVNIVTKSGTPYYSGMLHFRTDQFYADNSFNEYFAYYQFAGPEPITKYLLEKIGLRLPGRELNFISSANIKQTDTAYPYPDSRFKHFKQHKISLLGGLIEIPYTDRQSNEYSTTNKMTYIFNPALKVIAGYHTSGYRNYNYDHWWRDRPDSAHVSRNNTSHATLRLQHQFHPSTFYTVDYGRLERYWHQSVAELTPDKYDGNWYAQDLTGDGIADISMAQLWRDSRTIIHTLRGDLTSQIHRRHQMKTGLEFNFEDIESYDIQYPGYKPDRPLPSGSPFPEHGYYRWQLDNKPFNGAVYVQDKIELEGLTVNFGLRYDYVNPGKEVTDTLFINAWERATLLEYEGQGTRSQFSPRIAFGHPMSSRTVIYFSYGHFNQLPERQYFFRDPYAARAWVGNPNLKPPRTIAYEFGFDHQLSDFMALGVKGFYKDYFDYISLTTVGPADRRIGMFVNFDFASSKGFEVTLKRRFATRFGFEANYTYQITKGRSSSPFTLTYHPDWLLPREIRLDWDQNHTLNAWFQISSPPNDNLRLWGIKMPSYWYISTILRYGSGYPYTPAGRTTPYMQNTETKPYVYTIDFKLEKWFNLYKKLRLAFYCDITNLLNRYNAWTINNITGEPARYGDYNDPYIKRIYSWNETQSRLNPQRFESGRQILLGFKLEM